ncbi:MAG: hypothetical protein IPJ82_02320 [Lewinellaceae bacterium]|nr:hypothetical protein [Lewinellaceae bacterium]
MLPIKYFPALLGFLFSGSFTLFAQQVEKAPSRSGDSLGFQNFLRHGKFGGHARVYAMGTDNTGDLTDYYGLAAGVGLGYTSPVWKGFEAGISGFMIFNLASSNFSVKDSITGSPNRYEIGLFDIENPRNTDDLDRNEELFLRWSKAKVVRITAGRFIPQSPLINPQDGRMRPTLAQGIWVEAGPKEKWRVQAAWLTHFSPRSTVHWYSAGESIGIYPVGLNPDGSKSAYAGNLHSKGILIGAFETRVAKKLQVRIWDYYIDNILNVNWLEMTMEHRRPSGNSFSIGFQALHENALGDGGNPDPAKTYIEKGGESWMFGLRAGIRGNKGNLNVNYTRITPDGRLLMPREWGREPLYTFLPRERNEGLGGVHAFTINAEKEKNGWQYAAGLGYYDLPDVQNTRLNKYGLPSYTQVNLSVKHRFAKMLEGLEGTLLFVHKFAAGKIPENPKYLFNKVDMTLVNLVFDYHF